MRISSKIREESGVALVEFALVLPMVLVLLFGMIDVGRAVNYWIDATHLANVAARYAAVDKNPGAAASLTLQEHIERTANTDELRDGSDQVTSAIDVCVTYPEGTSVGDPVVVTATATYDWLDFLVGETGIGPSSPLRGSATMRLEAIPTDVLAGCG